MRVKVHSNQDHHFTFDIRSMKGEIDVTTTEPKGPNPKELVLAALCGCTGTDMVDLLKKFGVHYESFDVTASASLTDHHPKRFVSIDLEYRLRGAGIDIMNVVEAAKRSMHQYSGTAAMLSKACPINYRIVIGDDTVGKGTAEFTTD